MTGTYLGRLSEHDPLHGYLQHDIQPQITGTAGKSKYRVFGLNGSNDVYLYEDRSTGTKVIGKFFLSSRKKDAAKAELAQVLIGRAWQRTLAGERAVKPWPWADTWPVARLEAPDRDVNLFVLAGANGRTIAFGPGHVFGTANPGEAGNSAIGGHRDTHLQFLRDVQVGERLIVERPDGRRVAYRVSDTRVVDKSAVEVLGQSGRDRLTLITCWPFDALRAGGPERYVVEALREQSN